MSHVHFSLACGSLRHLYTVTTAATASSRGREAHTAAHQPKRARASYSRTREARVVKHRHE
eukprot:scaffold52054_cov59-Phaeocystis_antarctica.AAC.2